MLKIVALIACLILTSCMVGPDYKEPITPVNAHWIQKNASIKETPFHNTQWWNTFHDPVLINLINQGYQNNLSLQSTGASVLQARAQLAQAVGELYPQQQTLFGSYDYNRIGGSSLQSLLPPTFLTALVGFTASWEIDFWGKYRRAIEANDASFLASVAAYDNALITLTADIAKSYIQIRTLEAQIKITKENIKVQTIGLKIARSRFGAGQTSLVDVEQAQTELTETQSSLPPLISSLRTQKDLLAVLLGTLPGGVDKCLGKKRGIPRAPVTVAIGIPRETLARRPDIYQAREQAIAQSATIGATLATLYPSFSLTGSFAFASNNINGNSINQIFNWSNRNITAGPGFTWPILNYGQLTNEVRAQDAVFQQSLLQYMNLLLKAQQEVQDQMTNFIEAKKSEYFLAQSSRAAAKTLKLTMIRYREGEIDFTPVLIAEQQLLKVQRSWVSAQGDIPQALVSLYRALGGGWQIRKGNDIVPLSMKEEMAARTNWGSLLRQENHLPAETQKQQIKQLYLPTW